jgi:hypothetical protein
MTQEKSLTVGEFLKGIEPKRHQEAINEAARNHLHEKRKEAAERDAMMKMINGAYKKRFDARTSKMPREKK